MVSFMGNHADVVGFCFLSFFFFGLKNSTFRKEKRFVQTYKELLSIIFQNLGHRQIMIWL